MNLQILVLSLMTMTKLMMTLFPIVLLLPPHLGYRDVSGEPEVELDENDLAF